MVPFLVVNKAEAVDGGWAICDVVRSGVNAAYGYAYLELYSAGPDDGIFNNVIFQIDESIRKETLAIALTAISTGDFVKVYITNTTNGGYQVIKAAYTYTP
jgi:hypothetical protein